MSWDCSTGMASGRSTARRTPQCRALEDRAPDPRSQAGDRLIDAVEQRLGLRRWVAVAGVDEISLHAGERELALGHGQPVSSRFVTAPMLTSRWTCGTNGAMSNTHAPSCAISCWSLVTTTALPAIARIS